VADDAKRLESLEAQITALSDTRTNLVGLVEKLAGIQSELMSGGLDAYSDRLGAPFASISGAAEVLQELVEDMEIERNRIRNEE
jgi:hypothetical protein